MAPSGGGDGGQGGGTGPPHADGRPGRTPGGGGGGGWANQIDKTNGGNGAPGSVELIYTGSGGGTQPSNNVLRFIMFIPKHGGNHTKVIVRALTSGTIARLDVQYRQVGNIRLFGYDSGSAQSVRFREPGGRRGRADPHGVR